MLLEGETWARAELMADLYGESQEPRPSIRTDLIKSPQRR